MSQNETYSGSVRAENDELAVGLALNDVETSLRRAAAELDEAHRAYLHLLEMWGRFLRQ
jgi:hypothetical protein